MWYSKSVRKRWQEKGESKMTDKEAIKLISERAQELAKNPQVKEAMRNLYEGGESKEKIQATVFRLAIATLAGLPKEIQRV